MTKKTQALLEEIVKEAIVEHSREFFISEEEYHSIQTSLCRAMAGKLFNEVIDGNRAHLSFYYGGESRAD